jgi:hypothetical protein
MSTASLSSVMGWLPVNGIDAASGAYLLDPQSPRELAGAALAEVIPPDHLRELQHKWEQASNPHLGPEGGLDPLDLGAVGWGVVFSSGVGPEVRAALQPLLDLRCAQAGRYYKEFAGPTGWQPNDDYLDFLGRSAMGPGPAVPAKVPYYLLLVGSPEEIPFPFQYHLDVQYGVGRLYFETAAEYAQYAHGVVQAETGPPLRPRRLAFFASRNEDDDATRLSADELVVPLCAWAAGDFPAWAPQAAVGEAATKAALSRLLGGAATPALLFTAGHGLGLPSGDPRQRDEQGALLCQEWPGPRRWRRPIPPDFRFAADDVGPDADVRGLVSFHHACYGAGTPRLDEYPHAALKAQPSAAPTAFVARLPQRLLAHPAGGALAVLGHVERTWPCSFLWKEAGSQLAVYRGLLRLLLQGQRVGWAVEQFNQRYAELATNLTRILEDARFGKEPKPCDLAFRWTAHNDARGLIVLGDPAVRLSAAGLPPAGP